MSTNILRCLKVFGAGFMLATLMASFVAFSQEVSTPNGVADETAEGIANEASESDEFEPAVNTSVDEAAELDAMEPGVPTAVLAQDITRTQSGNEVMDRMDLGRTEITGNQELPKVMYIVPWKKADPGDLTGKPVNTLLDEVLAPLDREEFIRQVDYYDDLYKD
jgi:hypothetical protein